MSDQQERERERGAETLQDKADALRKKCSNGTHVMSDQLTLPSELGRRVADALGLEDWGAHMSCAFCGVCGHEKRKLMLWRPKTEEELEKIAATAAAQPPGDYVQEEPTPHDLEVYFE